MNKNKCNCLSMDSWFNYLNQGNLCEYCGNKIFYFKDVTNEDLEKL